MLGVDPFYYIQIESKIGKIAGLAVVFLAAAISVFAVIMTCW